MPGLYPASRKPVINLIPSWAALRRVPCHRIHDAPCQSAINPINRVLWWKTNSCQNIVTSCIESASYQPDPSCPLVEDDFMPGLYPASRQPVINLIPSTWAAFRRVPSQRIHDAPSQSAIIINPINRVLWWKTNSCQNIFTSCIESTSYQPDPSCPLVEDDFMPGLYPASSQPVINLIPSCQLVEDDSMPENTPSPYQVTINPINHVLL